jgi:hypothetical protein
MPMVQAEILRAVSGLDDSLAISTLTPDVRTVFVRSEGRSSVQGSTMPKRIPQAN